MDTDLEQGALEVQPASHTHDERPDGNQGSVTIAVPPGTVVFYSPNIVHRGRANRIHKERLALTMNLMGSNGLVPNGIPLAVHPGDAGRWWLVTGKLSKSE